MGFIFKSTLLFICFLLQVQFNYLKVEAQQSEEKEVLYLTPLIKKGQAKQARASSTVNSKQYFGLESHSGFITVNEEYNSNLFFWYFPTQNEMENSPWIIWLQGGPGYSSLKGLFDIIGPLQLVDGEVKLRNTTWGSKYSLLFVDNPVGAGFSFTNDERGYPTDEDSVGEKLYEFLQQFLELFPELRKAPLFLAGESYAGKYVPALGIQIHRHRNDTQPINLGGLIMGNALVDPRNMMKYSSLCRELGIVGDYPLIKIKELENSVVQLIDEKKMVDASNKFNETIEFIKKASGVNIYNFLTDPSSGAPEFEHYVQRPDVRDLIHVGNATFVLNNQLVYQKMLPDIMNTTKPFIEELLDYYPVLAYSGQLDLIVPYSLTKRAYNLFKWNGSDKYHKAKRTRILNQNGHIVAYKKSSGNFTEVLIRGGGHMVAAESPLTTRHIVEQFISQATKKQPLQ